MAKRMIFKYDSEDDTIFDRTETEKYCVTINKVCNLLHISRNKFYQDIYPKLDSMTFPERPKKAEKDKIKRYLNAIRDCRTNSLDPHPETNRANQFFNTKQVLSYFNKAFKPYVRTAPFTTESLFHEHKEEAEKLIKTFDGEVSKDPRIDNEQPNFKLIKECEEKLIELAKSCDTFDLYKHTKIYDSKTVVTDKTTLIPFVEINLPLKSIDELDLLRPQTGISRYSSKATKEIADRGGIAYRSIKKGQTKPGKVLYAIQEHMNVFDYWLLAPAKISIKYSSYSV